jgi:WD40 repeat protein
VRMSSLVNHKFLLLVCLLMFGVVLSLVAALGIREFQSPLEAPERTVHTDGIAKDIAISPDGDLIIMSLVDKANGEDGIQVLPVTTLRSEDIDVGAGLQWARVEFAPDGATFVIGGSWVVPRGHDDPQRWITQGVVQLWDTKTRSRRQRIVVGDQSVDQIARDPNGRYVYFTYDGPEGGSIRRVDLTTETVTDVIGPNTRVTVPWRGPWGAGQLAVSPDGRDLVVSSRNGTLVWDLREGRERFLAHASRCVAISPDGLQVALIDVRDVDIVDLRTGKGIRQLKLDKPVTENRGFVRFSSDGRLLAAGLNGGPPSPSYLQVWKTADYSHSVFFRCHSDCLLDMRFLPKTHTLVTTCANHTMSFWDLDRRDNTKEEGATERSSER